MFTLLMALVTFIFLVNSFYIGGAVSLTLGVLLSISYQGTKIDPEKQLYLKYDRFLWIKIGSWKSFSKPKYVTIARINLSSFRNLPTPLVLPDDRKKARAYKVNLEQVFIELKQQVETHKDIIASSLQIIEDILAEGRFKPVFENNFKSTSQDIIDWLNQTSTITPDFSVFTNLGLIDSLNGNKFRKSRANPLSSAEQKQAYIELLNFDSEPFEQLDSVIQRISLVFRRSLLHPLFWSYIGTYPKPIPQSEVVERFLNSNKNRSA